MVPFSPTYRGHSGFISGSSAVFAASICMCTFAMLGFIFSLIYAAGTSVVIRCLSSLADMAATVNIAAMDTVGELALLPPTSPSACQRYHQAFAYRLEIAWTVVSFGLTCGVS